jgi:hypothetical protein
MDIKLEIESLYKMLWNEEVCINHSRNEMDEASRSRFLHGVIFDKYKECEPLLLEVVSYNFTDTEFVSCILKNVKDKETRLRKTSTDSLMDKYKYESCLEEIALLEDGNIMTWINQYFLSWLRYANVQVLEEHVVGFCYVYYGYDNYYNSKNSTYNSDLETLKSIYDEFFNKSSALYTYGLIEIDKTCKLLAIDPPRLYDSKVDKTFYLSNIRKEILELFSSIQHLYNRLSIRVSNSDLYIFDGEYTEEILQEAAEFGKLFSIEGIGEIPITKLYSDDFNDVLWVRTDKENITFEELCSTENVYEDSIVTQVIHLKYEKSDESVYITHIDHEFVFYSKDDYEKRKTNVNIKGAFYRRLKSFKIDEAKIPLDMPCAHKVAILKEESNEWDFVDEKVPFIIFILKSYFNHTDLIDEYFEKLTGI